MCEGRGWNEANKFGAIFKNIANHGQYFRPNLKKY